MNTKVGFYSNKFLFLSFLISLSLISIRLPLWALMAMVGLLIWRFLIDRDNFPQPKRLYINLAAVLLVLVVRLDFGQFAAEEPTAAILALLTALKILELREQKDLAFLLLLGLSLIGVNFVFNIEIYVFLPSTLAFLLLMLAQLETKGKDLLSKWKLAFILRSLLLSAPLAAVLFVFFPRAATPIFGRQSSLHTSGSSDIVDPGPATEITLSNELVMRVAVEAGQTEVSTNYWRTGILSLQEGFQYSRSNIKADEFSGGGRLSTYAVTLEPRQNNTLPTTLNTVDVTGENFSVFKSPEGLFKFQNFGFQKRLLYTGVFRSDLNRRSEPSPIYLQTKNSTEKVKQLAAVIQGPAKNVTEKINALRKYFSSNKYSYTLKPGFESVDLDKFLFSGKKGFCEHYASAGASLLRLMKVQARVVTGYQGGVWNAYGNYWRIAEKDAHAWIEYLSDAGFWTVLDLVEVVAPLRVELGGIRYFDLSQDLLLAGDWNQLNRVRGTSFDSVWNQMSLYLESMNYQWTQFMLDFDFDRQSLMVGSTGLSIGIYFLFSVVAALIVAYIAFRLSKRAQKLQPSVRLYQSLIDWAEKKDIQKNPSEGAIDFSVRVLQQYPQLQRPVDAIIDYYVNDRFGKGVSAAQVTLAKRSLNEVEKS